MKCQCGAVEYAPAWCVLPGGAALPAGEPVYCAACTPQPATGIFPTEQYERFGATLPVVVPLSLYESGATRRERWRE